MYGEVNIYAQGADSIDMEGANPKKASKKATSSKSPVKKIKPAKKLISRSPSTVKDPDTIIDPSKSKKSGSPLKTKKILHSASSDKTEKTEKTDKSDKTESTIKTQKSVNTNKKLAKKIPVQYNFTVKDEASKPTERIYTSAIAPGELEVGPWLAPTNLAQENLDKTEELIIAENDTIEKNIVPRKKKPKAKKKKPVVKEDL
jgi:hypothetical protein